MALGATFTITPMKSLFVFTAEKGKPKFAPQTEILFRQHVKDHEGKVYEIHLRESKRTLTQNAYYWAYLELIESETVNTASDLHEYLRRKLLPAKFITVLDEEIKVPRSTTELTKWEFSDYLDKISALTEIPLPDPQAMGYISNH